MVQSAKCVQALLAWKTCYGQQRGISIHSFHHHFCAMGSHLHSQVFTFPIASSMSASGGYNPIGKCWHLEYASLDKVFSISASGEDSRPSLEVSPQISLNVAPTRLNGHPIKPTCFMKASSNRSCDSGLTPSSCSRSPSHVLALRLPPEAIMAAKSTLMANGGHWWIGVPHV